MDGRARSQRSKWLACLPFLHNRPPAAYTRWAWRFADLAALWWHGQGARFDRLKRVLGGNYALPNRRGRQAEAQVNLYARDPIARRAIVVPWIRAFSRPSH